MKKKLSRNTVIRRDDTTSTIAQLFDCDDSYVRKIMADKEHIIYKGERAMAIRRAYLKYKHGKAKLIQKITTTQAA